MTITDPRNGVSVAPDPTTSRNMPEDLSMVPRGRDGIRVLAGLLLQEFRQFANTMTEFAERIQGRVVNHVLGVETCVFDASATPVFRTWHAAAGCVEIRNRSAANTMTVVAAGAAGAAPTSGVGVYVVPAATKVVIALASRQMTVYGTAADSFSYQAFTLAPTPVI